MKLKSLFLLTVVTATIAGCSSNEPNINPRLSKPSTYSLSIYATDRANINVYSPKDDAITDVSDEVPATEVEEVLDASKKQMKRPITTTEYRKNVMANSSNSDKQIIEQESGKADARATPVMLKIFQLTDKSLFLSSTYDDFRGNDFADSLGKTYVSNIDLIVAPNQFRFIDAEPMNDKTHYIGVVALFNGYENRKWKGIVRVNPKGGESYPLLIRVLDSKVEIHKDN